MTARLLKTLFDEELAAAEEKGVPWRSVVDSMVPDVNALWNMMDSREQKLFQKVYGPAWNNARYRIPEHQWNAVKKHIDSGRIEVAGGLIGVRPVENGWFEVHLRKEDGSVRVVRTRKVVNNTGPSRRPDDMPNFAQDLVAAGDATIHPSGGLAVDDHFRLMRKDGYASQGVYALGPIVAGAHPEAMTVPAIRENARALAHALLADQAAADSGRREGAMRPLRDRFDKPSQAEIERYAREMIRTGKTSDPRDPNGPDIVPTTQIYGQGFDADGRRIYIPARADVHARIVADALRGAGAEPKTPPPGRPYLMSVAGGMSVGMTYMQRLLIAQGVVKPEHTVVITPQTFEALHEFAVRGHYQHPEKSPLLVDEYYDVARDIVDAAMARGLNVLFVDQADRAPDVLAMTARAKSEGYQTALLGMTMTPEAYYDAAQLWLTRFNRLPDHQRGFGDLQEFSSAWPDYAQAFDTAMLFETVFHTADIDKTSDDLTRREYTVRKVAEAHLGSERVLDVARYEDFKDRGRYINDEAGTPGEARRDYPYADAPQLTGSGASRPAETSPRLEAAEGLPGTLDAFTSGDFEKKFVELVRGTSARRAAQAAQRGATVQDYAVADPKALSEEFKASLYAKSLTNVSPRHYSEAEKARLFTLAEAQRAVAQGEVRAPKDRTVIWSGGYIANHPLGYGRGRMTVENWLVARNAEIEGRGAGRYSREELYHTVAMTPGSLHVLNPMWDDPTVPMETKVAVTPTYITAFPPNARGEVTLNVDDTDLDSFFRQNELPILMANHNITRLRVVRAGLKDGFVDTAYPDLGAWYEAQKDQWVDSIAGRYKQTAAGTDKTLADRMARALAEEAYDSYKNMVHGNPLLTAAGGRRADPARARAQLERLAPLFAAEPSLLDRVPDVSESDKEGLKTLLRGLAPEAGKQAFSRSAKSAANVPDEGEVLANARFMSERSNDRLALVMSKLGVDPAQARLVLRAHDEFPCQVGDCAAQLLPKLRALRPTGADGRKAGLTAEQARRAIELGLAGQAPAEPRGPLAAARQLLERLWRRAPAEPRPEPQPQAAIVPTPPVDARIAALAARLHDAGRERYRIAGTDRYEPLRFRLEDGSVHDLHNLAYDQLPRELRESQDAGASEALALVDRQIAHGGPIDADFLRKAAAELWETDQARSTQRIDMPFERVRRDWTQPYYDRAAAAVELATGQRVEIPAEAKVEPAPLAVAAAPRAPPAERAFSAEPDHDLAGAMASLHDENVCNLGDCHNNVKMLLERVRRDHPDFALDKAHVLLIDRFGGPYRTESDLALLSVKDAGAKAYGFHFVLEYGGRVYDPSFSGEAGLPAQDYFSRMFIKDPAREIEVLQEGVSAPLLERMKRQVERWAGRQTFDTLRVRSMTAIDYLGRYHQAITKARLAAVEGLPARSASQYLGLEKSGPNEPSLPRGLKFAAPGVEVEFNPNLIDAGVLGQTANAVTVRREGQDYDVNYNRTDRGLEELQKGFYSKRLLDVAALKKISDEGGVILDMAGSDGRSVQELRAQGVNAFTLDVVPGSVARDHMLMDLRRVPGQDLRLTPAAGDKYFLWGDAGRTPLADGSVRVIYDTYGLMYYEPSPKILKEWARLLEPGGVIRFSPVDYTQKGAMIELARGAGLELSAFDAPYKGADERAVELRKPTGDLSVFQAAGLSDAQRETALERMRLTPPQIAAVMAAHGRGRPDLECEVYRCSRRQLREKLRLMERADIKSDLAKKLVREGYAGLAPSAAASESKDILRRVRDGEIFADTNFLDRARKGRAGTVKLLRGMPRVEIVPQVWDELAVDRDSIARDIRAKNPGMPAKEVRRETERQYQSLTARSRAFLATASSQLHLSKPRAQSAELLEMLKSNLSSEDAAVVAQTMLSCRKNPCYLISGDGHIANGVQNLRSYHLDQLRKLVEKKRKADPSFPDLQFPEIVVWMN